MSITDISPTQSPALSTASLYSVPPLPCLRICSSPSRTTNMLRACSPSRSSCAPGTTLTHAQLAGDQVDDPVGQAGEDRDAGQERAIDLGCCHLPWRPELYLCRARRAKAAAQGRGFRQALAGEALGELRVGVVGREGQRAARLVERPPGADRAPAGRGRGWCARAAGRCPRRRRRRPPDRAGGARRRPAPCRAACSAAASRHPGGGGGAAIGGDRARVVAGLDEEVAEPPLPFAVGHRRAGGAAIDRPRLSRPARG